MPTFFTGPSRSYTSNMEFSTPVIIEPSPWKIEPCERMLFVGSCFADNMGRRFTEEKFRAVVNPYGVMYNPASIVHTVQRLIDDGAMPFAPDEQGTAVFTLGTNHVYILKQTGEIVDNCAKRPQRLFEEQALNIDACANYLRQAIDLIHAAYPKVRFILTVSPIRYRKYGYHGSQLSKATLLLAIDQLLVALARRDAGPSPTSTIGTVTPVTASYFPSYEIVNDELRDYRFYQPDMLHPSDQAVSYIYERMAACYFSADTHRFLQAWAPLKAALAHRPFDPDSEAYKTFRANTLKAIAALQQRYPQLTIDNTSPC